MSSQIQNMHKLIDQLRQEASVERIPVSRAIQDLMNYVNQNSAADALLIGVSQSDNPFRDQKNCTIL